MVCKKVTLFVKAYSQHEGIEYNKTFSLNTRHEALQIFLFYAAHKYSDVYQMDVKCAFLNGVLKATVSVEQPLEFVNDKFLDHFYIFEKAVYGLKQAPCAWYATLRNILKIAKC